MSLRLIRKQNPLLWCITNIVVANFTANGLLAVGASPCMADAKEELEDFAAISSALSLNMGTLDALQVEVMKKALNHAKGNIPVLLDPVGAGASTFRQKTAKELVALKPDAIRCNAGEFAALAGLKWSAKGVDAGSGELDYKEAARDFAAKHDLLLVITGQSDFITDGKSSEEVLGGNEQITLVTGSGCLLSALITALLPQKDSFKAILQLLKEYKKAASLAASASKGPGSLAMHFLDALHEMSKDAL